MYRFICSFFQIPYCITCCFALYVIYEVDIIGRSNAERNALFTCVRAVSGYGERLFSDHFAYCPVRIADSLDRGYFLTGFGTLYIVNSIAQRLLRPVRVDSSISCDLVVPVIHLTAFGSCVPAIECVSDLCRVRRLLNFLVLLYSLAVRKLSRAVSINKADCI